MALNALARLGWTILILAATPAGVLVLAYLALGGNTDQANVHVLQVAAWGVLAASIAFPLLLAFLAFICGDRRSLLALIFPPLALLSVCGLAAVLLVQGALLIAAVALYAESHHGPGIGARVALGVTIAVVATSFALLRSAAKMTGSMYVDALGIVLHPEDSPRLFSYVRQLAERLGAPAPRQIVLGLEPTFYVTTAPVRLAQQPIIRGETLYISALLVRILGEHELAAVIGHELGHFRGRDTVYSRRFAPAFAALDHAIVSMTDEERGPRWLALPALLTLALLFDIFALNVAKVSRRRELEADRAGAECSSDRAIATALLKCAWYDLQWNAALERNAQRLTKIEVASNLSLEFSQVERGVPAEMAVILAASPPHPIDTHPPLGDRLYALGFQPSDFSQADVAPAQEISLSVDDLDAREVALTRMQHKFMLETRYGALGERNQRATLVRAAALLGASFAVIAEADDPTFPQFAEERGKDAMRDFDASTFRAYFASRTELPDLAVATETIGALLVSDEGKHVLLGYLEALSQRSTLLKQPFAAVKDAWG